MIVSADRCIYAQWGTRGATYTIARGAGAAAGELIIGDGKTRQVPVVDEGELI